MRRILVSFQCRILGFSGASNFCVFLASYFCVFLASDFYVFLASDLSRQIICVIDITVKVHIVDVGFLFEIGVGFQCFF